MNDKQYIIVLIDSLQKKERVLLKIDELNRQQTEILSKEEVDMDAWEANVDAKAECIEELGLLDDGFESVYEKVREPLMSGKQEYAVEIKRLQELIKTLTDHSVSIQADEHRNKELAQKEFSRQKKNIKSVKQSKHVANLYDTSMKKLGYVGAQFMDKKK